MTGMFDFYAEELKKQGVAVGQSSDLIPVARDPMLTDVSLFDYYL